MATKSTVPTVANGDSWSAAQQNTYLRDNIEAVWPYTTAGDLSYASAANQLARLGIGAAYQLLRTNSAGNAPEWGGLPFATASLYNATGYSNNSTTERDVPNSSGTITLLAQSTIIMIARLFVANGTGNCISSFRTSIDGTSGNLNSFSYGDGIGIPVVLIGMKTGVAAGARTLKLREKESYGGGVSYGVDHKEWIALAIPE